MWSLILLLIQPTLSIIASFTGGHSFLLLADLTPEFQLSFNFETPLSYGLLFALRNSSNHTTFSLSINNGTLLSSHGDRASTTNILQNAPTSIYLSETIVTANGVHLPVNIPPDITSITIGGYPSPIGPYHQFYGIVWDMTLSGVTVTSERVLSQNVKWKEEPGVADEIKVVTVNHTSVQFPIANTDFTEFDIRFEFKTPESRVTILVYELAKFSLSLMKEGNQLVLRHNLYGQNEQLVVAVSAQNWTTVRLTVSDTITGLSAGDRVSEVRSSSPVVSRRFHRKPVFIGPGFLGCVRGFEEGVMKGIAEEAGTLVGCSFPEGCGECEGACSRTWTRVRCVTNQLRGAVEFASTGILFLEQDLTDETVLNLTLSMVTETKNDAVLVTLKHSDRNSSPFLTLQLIDGYLMLTFAFSNLLTDTNDLNNGELHTVTIGVTQTSITFQVDGKLKELPYIPDSPRLTTSPTLVIIGGSSPKINRYWFTGCLTELKINGRDILEIAERSSHESTNDDNALFGQCSIMPVNKTQTPEPIIIPLQTENQYLLATTVIPEQIDNVIIHQDGIHRPTKPNNQSNNNEEIKHMGYPRPSNQLLIAIIVGLIVIFVTLIFLGYYLWQRRQIKAAERTRIQAEEFYLDEELLKTYNPKVAPKFTPNALDMIEEEGESDCQSSTVGTPI